MPVGASTARAPRILGSTDPGLRRSWALWSLGSVDPGLCGYTGLHGSTDSADPQAPRIHNSTIQLFYIKIIMSTENHPTLMNANGKMSIT